MTGRSVVLATVIGAQALLAAPTHVRLAGALQVTEPPFSSQVRTKLNEFHVLDYGAKCDGSIYDTAGIQAAANAARATSGTVVLPIGNCYLDDTVTFGNLAAGPAGGYSSINLRGQGQYSTSITGTGAFSGNGNTKIALAIRHMSAFNWSDFKINGPGFVDGSQAVGISVGDCIPSCGSGTLNTLQNFERIGVSGWRIGMYQGESASSSEMVCTNCNFSFNDIGFLDNNFNTLNFWFFGMHIGFNNCGFGGNSASDAIHVYGGDSAGNMIADFCAIGFGNLSIDGFRSESSVMVDGMTHASGAVVNTSITNSASTAQGTSVYINAGSLNVVNSTFGVNGNGQIKVTGAGAANITITGTAIKYDNGWPIILPSWDDRFTDATVFAMGNYGQGCPNTINCAPLQGTFLGTDFVAATPRPEPGSYRVTFAGASTAAVTFARTATVNTTNATKNLTFSANVLTGADVGKTISIAGASTTCGLGPNGPSPDAFRGTINTVTSTTAATVIASSKYATGVNGNFQCFNYISTTAALTATIGKVMPTADYAATVTCNANETFWITGKSTTGLTVNSSNASSTAVCDVHVGRTDLQ